MHLLDGLQNVGKFLNFENFVISILPTFIHVVSSKFVNSTPRQLFENLILLQMISKYVYWVYNSILGI